MVNLSKSNENGVITKNSGSIEKRKTKIKNSKINNSKMFFLNYPLEFYSF